MIRITAKTLDEAITRGLAELGVTREEAEIEIIEEGCKGLFGIGCRDAVIEVCKKTVVKPQEVAREEFFFNDATYDKAVDYLKELLLKMEIPEPVFSKAKSDNGPTIQIETGEAGSLIGKRGQTLNAIQYLLNIYLNRSQEEKIFFNLDIAEYRSNREKSLQELSRKLAQKVKDRGKNIELEPMSSRERRIIHMALKNHPHVTTFSKGDEPYRKVVISPKGRRPPRRQAYEDK